MCLLDFLQFESNQFLFISAVFHSLTLTIASPPNNRNEKI